MTGRRRWDWWGGLDSQNWWEIGPTKRWEMGGWPEVGDGRLRALPPQCWSALTCLCCIFFYVSVHC